VSEDGTIKLNEVHQDRPFATAADNVDNYIKDASPLAMYHVMHRRYTLAYALKKVAFGQYNGYNAMYIDLENGPRFKKPVPYPFAGPVPYDMFKNISYLTFSHPNIEALKGHPQMTVTDLETRAQKLIPGEIATPDTLAFEDPDYGNMGFLRWGLKPETVFFKAGHKYQVELKTDKCTWSYVMAPIECNVKGNSTEPISTEIKEVCR
jgi:hypothetical protein